ncbi:hydrogenase maturation protease [Mobiluncus mulieris 28-1]|nr:hydrogenase maturation protease [Mobiluncus mulieris]EEJ53161.1 hydrogenase maturation protease [Mobiluncus mulieris ATCC 35243]EEZ92344.1 hydrogenase maturation protease [Mobiluncus mulieris 28-1]EFN93660.1 hydrogenase maturation protease [Mobiluncus mulieris FB024-16]MBB5847354.1 hydrogenase maturation protease [Mobiluncus mulieris]MCU9971162.1 hydrogenase maturation protease [Mobiluncus mulieris]
MPVHEMPVSTVPSPVGRPNPGFSGTPSTIWAGAKHTVLAVGNSIMGDDRIGLEILSRLQGMLRQRPSWDAAVQRGELAFVEGGISGMELVPVVQESSRLLILDSIAPGDSRPPGQALRLQGDHVPRLLSMKLSPHQVGLLDVLTAARLTKREPEVIEVVGVVGAKVELRLGMSREAAFGLEQAVQYAVDVLDEWLG